MVDSEKVPGLLAVASGLMYDARCEREGRDSRDHRLSAYHTQGQEAVRTNGDAVPKEM